MATSQTIFSFLEGPAKANGFLYEVRKTGNIQKTRCELGCGPLALHSLADMKSGLVTSWVVVRTSSFDWGGERTDLHDVIAHLLAVFLRAAGHSCSLWEVYNPAIYIPGEVYAYELRFDQGPLANLRTGDTDLSGMASVLLTIALFWRRFWLSFWSETQPLPEGAYEWEKSTSWASRACSTVGCNINDDGVLYTWRHNPTWMHFRSAATGHLAINCYLLARSFRKIKPRHEMKILHGPSSILCRSGDLMNAVPLEELSKLRACLERLERRNDCDDLLIAPSEDRLIVVGRRHIVTGRVKSSH